MIMSVENKNDYIVVNFSGGKDSTALTLRMIELGLQIDEVVCCDTYKEFPAMYRHIEKIKKVVENAGIKFTLLRSEKSFDYLMFEHPVKRKNKEFEGFLGYSWAGNLSRWCTSKLKIDVINKYLSKLKQQYNVIQVVGIAADEQYRLVRENNKQENQRHLLVEWGWTEKDCLEYCYSKGYDWEGLYGLFERVSCWCCPLQPLEELRKLRKYFPDLWQELKDMDARTWRKFKPTYTVEQLDIRFAFEDERIDCGLSITNKDFYKKLNERLAQVNDQDDSTEVKGRMA